MYTLIEDARVKDKEERYSEQAYEAYCHAIKNDEAELFDYLAAANLAFLFQDSGFTYKNQVADEVADAAGWNIFPLLEKAREKFGDLIEIKFWESHYKQFYKDVSFSYEEYLSQGCTHALIGINRDNNTYDKQRMELKVLVKDKKNSLDRYILSMIE